MKVFHLTTENEYRPTLEAVQQPQVMAVGDFDGVHSGHREVLKRAVETAARLGIVASVLTFHPHPREVLGLNQYKESLTPLEDKLALFASLGLHQVYLVRFDEQFSRLSPEHFVEQIIVPAQVETLVVGFDFTFGHRGAGNADSLGHLAAGRFAVEVVRPFHRFGEKVSSTLIRECLLNGQVEKASQLLERPYSITGKIVNGEGRGRTIGVPTANVEPMGRYVIPGRGVYAIWADVEGERFGGVMNIGWKPTFAASQGKDTLEAHLFDFDRTIYGSDITISFAGFIRQERKFGSVEELVAQIRSDMTAAKELLG